MGLGRFTFLLLFLLVLSNLGPSYGGRSGGSRSSSSRRTSSHRSSSGGRTSSGGRSGGSQTHTTSGSATPSQKVSVGQTFGSRDHTTSTGGASAGSRTSYPSGTSTGQTTHQQNKDLSTALLHAEGGGATRPAQTGGFGGTHPPVPPNNDRKPDFTTDYKQNSSPYKPSAPPVDQASKFPSAPPLYGQPGTPSKIDYGTPNYGNPHWSNPQMGQNQHIPTPSQPPHIGFQPHIYPQTSHPVNSPYPPPPHTNPPYPTTHNNPPHLNTHNSPPYPVPQGNPPYPVTHGNPAYPTTHGNPHYPMTHSNPPPPIGGQSFGYPTHPSPYHPNQVPISNPYSMHSTGSAYAPAHPSYPQQPQYFAQPAAQPYIPGQTVLVVPGQSDSGRGLGQMFKEALVFSTVNAAVQRVINPHHDHHYFDSRPQAAPAVNNTTTHITYNNQYFNTAPGNNGSTGMTATPQDTFPSGNYPTGGTSAGSSIPTGSNFAGGSYPGGGNYPTGGSPVGGNNPTGGNNPNIAGPTGSISSGGTSSGPNMSSNQQNTISNAAANGMPEYRISDEDLLKITEVLFAKNTFNGSKYIKLNLQTRVTSANVTDKAREPLFYVEPLALEYPSIYVTRALYDNYEHDSRKKENRTLERRKEENLLIDTYLNTNVMVTALQWLTDRGFIDPDDFERKDVLRRIWFSQFDGTTSGFERIFMSENYADTAIVGVQNWLYFEYEETRNRINYMGYVGALNIGDTASLLKLHFEMDGIVRPNATILVGTMPEFEMALYTICYYARPNAVCPVSLNGTKFHVYTHSFRYFGNDLIDLAVLMVDDELFK